MKKIVVQLVQDTPMWHFQGAFDDCCLRATEVKPKLDRFLLAKLDKGELSVNGCALTSRDDVPSTWWANEDKTAFNYKMRISAQSRSIIESQVPDLDRRTGQQKTDRNGKPVFRNLYPIYFARVGADETGDMELVKMSGIRVELIVSDDRLAECIEPIIPAFFASHSFGARQDKGFGCFRVVEDPSCKSKENTPTIGVLSGASYFFVVPGLKSSENDKKEQDEQKKRMAEEKQFQNLFQHINYFHKVIRSGVNDRGCYVKSMMYHYAKYKKDVWDKPVIRTAFNYRNTLYRFICGKVDEDKLYGMDRRKVTNRDGGLKPVRSNLSNEYERNRELMGKKNLYRDALGLSTSQDWISYGNKVKTSLHGNKNDEVRFKSPIDYRPELRDDGGFNVYIIIHELPDELKKARFDISCDKSRERLEGMKISGAISISDYFDFIYKNRWRINQNWKPKMGEKNEDRDCLNIQPGKENREPYTLITQVFRTLNKVVK